MLTIPQELSTQVPRRRSPAPPFWRNPINSDSCVYTHIPSLALIPSWPANCASWTFHPVFGRVLTWSTRSSIVGTPKLDQITDTGRITSYTVSKSNNEVIYGFVQSKSRDWCSKQQCRLFLRFLLMVWKMHVPDARWKKDQRLDVSKYNCLLEFRVIDIDCGFYEVELSILV